MSFSEKKKLMDIGRRIAYLKRCVLAQKLLEKHETQCTVRKRTFEIHIKPVLVCSYQSFNNMMNQCNPQKQIENLEIEKSLIKGSKVEKM